MESLNINASTSSPAPNHVAAASTLTSPSSNANVGSSKTSAADPYIGCKINLISMLDIRYEGTLHAVNGDEKTFTLSQVRSYGTEDRPVVCRVEAPEKTYQFVVFKAVNVKDMFVSEETLRSDLGLDPAVITFKPAYFSTAGGSPNGGNRGNYPNGNNGIHNHHSMMMINGAKQQNDMRRNKMDDYYNNKSMMLNQRAAKTGVFEKENFANKSNASMFTSDYDFIRANEVFQQKMDELNDDDKKNASIGEETAKEASELIAEAIGDKHAPKSEADDVHLKAVYNKKVSFFDNISCETIEKSEGTYRPHDWQTERKTNQQTFGFSGLRRQYISGVNGSMAMNFNGGRPMNNWSNTGGRGGNQSGGGDSGYNFKRDYRRPFQAYHWNV